MPNRRRQTSGVNGMKIPAVGGWAIAGPFASRDKFVRLVNGKDQLMRAVHAVCLALSLASPAFAQTATPEATSLAKQLVAKIEPNPQQTISQLGGSMVGMMQQMGIKNPEHAQVIVREALLPLLSEHIGELSDRSAAAYAETLSVDDLKATIAFYDTKAGQDLIKAQPMLAQRRIQGMTAWMGALQPEMQTRITAVMKQHGWDKETN